MDWQLEEHINSVRVDGLRYAKDNPLRKTMEMLLHFLKTTRSTGYSYSGVVDRLYNSYERDNYTFDDCKLLFDKFNYSAKLLVTGELFDDEDAKTCYKVLEELFTPLSRLYYKKDIEIYAQIKQEDSLTYILPPSTTKNKNSSNDLDSEYSNRISENEFTEFNLAWAEDYFTKIGWKISRKGKRQVDLYLADAQLLYAISYLKKHIF